MSTQAREERLKIYLKERETAEEMILRGEVDAAQTFLEQARQKASDDGDDDFRLLFESMHGRTSKPEDSHQVELLNQAIQWETEQGIPHEQVLLLAIGQFYSEAGDQDSAIAWFSESLNINPSDCGTLRSTGVAIAKQGDWETALKWFDTALVASENEDSFSWKEKALAEQQLGDHDNALKSMEQAVHLRPDLWKADQEKLEKLCKKSTTQPNLPQLPTIPQLPGVTPSIMPSISPGLISELSGESDELHKEDSPIIDDDEPIGGMDAETYGVEVEKETKSEIPQVNEEPTKSVDIPLEKMVQNKRKECCIAFQKRFLAPSILPKDRTLWLFLRNNIAPDLGFPSSGGHFLWNRGTGTVIDPGRGFLDSLHRFGGTLAEIRNIIITHDNDSQLAEFETIHKLLLQGNLAKNVRFYLNLGAIQKLSAVVDLNDKSFSEGYLTLYNGATYDLLGGGKIKALPAYHQEHKSVDQAVGLLLTLENNGEEKKIVYTSDTGLFPLTLTYDSAENRIVPISDKNQTNRILSRRYKDDGAESADLMVLHLGSVNVQFEPGVSIENAAVKVNEMEHLDDLNRDEKRPEESQLAELCSVGQLGFLGSRELLTQCRPKFAVICQWSRELGPLRTDLSRLMQKQIADTNAKIVPGDHFLVYDIFADSAYDCVQNGWTASQDITAAEHDETLYYFAEEAQNQFISLPEYYSNRFMNDLKYKQNMFFK